AVSRGLDLEALVLEDGRHQLRDALLVVDDQHPRLRVCPALVAVPRQAHGTPLRWLKRPNGIPGSSESAVTHLRGREGAQPHSKLPASSARSFSIDGPSSGRNIIRTPNRRQDP